MSGPSLSLIDNGSSGGGGGIGHYKGVMLCNRPFAGTAAPAKPQSTSEKASFNCGVVPVTTGINIPISMKEKMLKRPKKDSVLVKHKKWLADFQKTKERLEEQLLDEMQRKEDSQQKFQDYEKRMRELSRSTLKDVPSEEKESTFHGNNNLAESKSSASIKYADAKGEMTYASGKSKKPAWALSETNAEALHEAKLQSEEDDLLNFVDNLNYDQTIADIEIKVMTEKIRKRIEELEKDVEVEETRDADAEMRAMKREMLELMGKAEQSIKDYNANQSDENKAAVIAAKALLEEDEEIQQIHSAKSVVALLKTAKEKIKDVSNAVRPPPNPKGEIQVFNEPKIVIHDPGEGRMDEKVKNSVSNLPYMHRNPAV